MKMTKLPPSVVNCLWYIRQQLTASGFAALKCNSNFDFTRFGRKIKINRNLFRILRNLFRILRNFTDTSIKIHIDDVKSFVTFRISLDFFLFFRPKCAKSQLKNKKNRHLFGMLPNFAHHLYVFL